MKRLACLLGILFFSAPVWVQFVGSPTWFADTYRIAADRAAARAAAVRAEVAKLPPALG